MHVVGSQTLVVLVGALHMVGADLRLNENRRAFELANVAAPEWRGDFSGIGGRCPGELFVADEVVFSCMRHVVAMLRTTTQRYRYAAAEIVANVKVCVWRTKCALGVRQVLCLRS